MPLSRRDSLLVAASMREVERWLYSAENSRVVPSPMELAVLRLTQRLRAIQARMGREFCLEDIEVRDETPDEPWLVPHLGCATAGLGFAVLSLDVPASSWSYHPDIIFSFPDDPCRAPHDPESNWLDVGPPPPADLTGIPALRERISQDTLEAVCHDIRVEALSRLQRRIRQGEHELLLDWDWGSSYWVGLGSLDVERRPLGPRVPDYVTRPRARRKPKRQAAA